MNETITFLAQTSNEFRPARLSSLYADLDRLKRTNPDGYAANVKTWQEGLCRATKAGAIPGNEEKLVLRTGPSLMASLETEKFGPPPGLHFVIEDARREKQIIPLDQYLTAAEGIYGRPYSLGANNIIRRGLQYLGLDSKPSNRSVATEFVLMKNLEEYGTKVMAGFQQRQGPLDRVLPRKLFEKEVIKTLGLSRTTDTDMTCLLTFLSRDTNQIVYDVDVVKLARSGLNNQDITDNDKAIASLKAASAGLSEQIEELSVAVEEHTQAARAAINSNNRQVALRRLRSRKLSEDMLGKRSTMLTQVEDAYNKIEQALDHVEFVRVMRQTTSALRALNAEAGDPEDIAKAVDELRDEMAQAEDIEIALGASSTTAALDDIDIERELRALEISESKVLPEPPTVEPSTLGEGGPGEPGEPQDTREIAIPTGILQSEGSAVESSPKVSQTVSSDGVGSPSGSGPGSSNVRRESPAQIPAT